ncbi:MFS transporter [Mycolicibacterium sp. S2-37]|uniref:CynX/NimT family MFS transporter n=1 Tax=Mycolicibacterium sp. S2-37 TaxID=2810297 RepID=UPI001A95065E|nr:MFS transporter [Mycolicibacterium sp. S2-37]MBO0678686.1 MFS transporter [Mycolicibacterium sp. S2-37]
MLAAALAIMLVSANLRPAVVAVAPLVGEIKAATGWSSAVTGLLTTLPVLVFGLVAPLAPWAAARFGIERTVLASLAFLVVGAAVRVLPDPVALFGGSALAGAGIGVCNVVLPSLIKRDFARRSGLMTGLYSMTLSGGAATAAAVTIPVNNALDGNWRMTLASWAVLALVAMIAWLPMLRRLHRMDLGPKPEPLWRNGIAWAITIFMAAQSLIFYTFTAWLPDYLIERGMSAAGAGAVLALGQVAGLLMSLVAPIVAGRFDDQRLVTAVALLLTAIGFVGLLATDSVPTLWVLCVMAGPGASISLALLFMVLRSTSTAQTGQVSGMSQSVGYILAAVGPVGIGALHDLTGSWTIAMAALSLALIPQAAATMVAGRNVKMSSIG